MKLGITGIRDLNKSFLAMRNERWQYLLAFGLVITLVILFTSSILLNIYQITMLVISTTQEISAIHQYQAKNKTNSFTPVTTNVNDWHLFGSSPVVVTNGNFHLIGIEYSYYDSSRAKAIISDNSGEEGIYRVGDKLPQGAIIEKIEPQKVTVLFNGTLMALPLKWEDEENILHNKNPKSNIDAISTPQSLNKNDNNSLLNSMIPPDVSSMLNRGWPND